MLWWSYISASDSPTWSVFEIVRELITNQPVSPSCPNQTPPNTVNVCIFVGIDFRGLTKRVMIDGSYFRGLAFLILLKIKCVIVLFNIRGWAEARKPRKPRKLEPYEIKDVYNNMLIKTSLVHWTEVAVKNMPVRQSEGNNSWWLSWMTGQDLQAFLTHAHRTIDLLG